MDELTLNDEKYISSKRAAKLTGYTKDYVGQLCREGKIIAQLVGRNWYVSEVSIHKHRFESEDQPTSQATTKDITRSEGATRRASHDAVRYAHDEATIIPLQKKETEKEKDAVQTPEVEMPRSTQKEVQPQKEKSDSLSTMQNAWQEWFTTAAHTIKKDSYEPLKEYLQKELSTDIEDGHTNVSEGTQLEDTDTRDSQNHDTQPVSVRKMSSVHLTREDEYVKRDAPSDNEPEEYFYSQRSAVAHYVNIVFMIIALVFFVVALLNIFLHVNTGIHLLNSVSGMSVYMAK